MSDVPEDVQMNLAEPEDDPDEEGWPGSTRTWTTAKQWAWLTRTRGPYLAAKKIKRRAVYLETLYTDFLDEWSECYAIYGHRDEARLSPEEKEVLAEAVAKRKMQLLVWHKNKDRQRASTRRLSSLLAAIGVSKKAGRLPQAQEIFSADYYDTDVKPIVKEKTKAMESELGRKLDRKERLNNVKACTKEAFKVCSEEIKREIKKKQAQAKEDAENGRAGRALTPEASTRTPQQYQDALQLAPKVFEGIIEPYCASSGWAFSLVGAGPLPEENGKIGHMSAHFGHKAGGPTFAQAHPNFEEQCVIPMGKFAKQVFPREVQQQRSLQASRKTSQAATSSSAARETSPVPYVPTERATSASQFPQPSQPPVIPSNSDVPVGPSAVIAEAPVVPSNSDVPIGPSAAIAEAVQPPVSAAVDSIAPVNPLLQPPPMPPPLPISKAAEVL